MSSKKIAVLAVQGAFAEHIDRMKKLGAECIELRQRADLEQDFDGLILPGGESTVQGKLLRELSIFEPLREKIQIGLPVFGTCAGLILLAQELSNDEHVYFGTLPVRVQRNAYGRQLGSFHTEQEVKGIGKVPMTFIRAPYIESVVQSGEKRVEILAEVDGRIVAVRYGNQLGVAFHPELDADNRIHEMFLQMCGC
ncbi:MAG: pyridoxal 5'-phosphate synthase glutaminase subunit PdxT [Lachnospiraceae bacterium]|nr:pyridoxal 5'-phosphate synthase glutaminase subunit PdxT [Lachnospiraceae bacterium]